MSYLINSVSVIMSGVALILLLVIALVLLDEHLRRRSVKAAKEALAGAGIDTGCFADIGGENRFRKFLRRSLGAHYQHHEIGSPSGVELKKESRAPKAENPLEHNIIPAIHAKDAVISRTEVRVDWLDWLRILFGCVLQVNVVTYTENPPGMVRSESKAFAWMK